MTLQHYIVLRMVKKGIYSGVVVKTFDAKSAAAASPWGGSLLVFPAEAGEVFKMETRREAVESIRSVSDLL